jgi:hypothetical protein
VPVSVFVSVLYMCCLPHCSYSCCASAAGSITIFLLCCVCCSYGVQLLTLLLYFCIASSCQCCCSSCIAACRCTVNTCKESGQAQITSAVNSLRLSILHKISCCCIANSCTAADTNRMNKNLNHRPRTPI